MKKTIIFFLLSASLSQFAWSQAKKPAPAGPKPLRTRAEKVSYAIGFNVANNILQQGFDSLQIGAISRAIEDVVKKRKLALSPEEGNSIINAYFQELQGKKGDKNVSLGKKFLEDNKNKPGVVELPSGLQYLVLKEGTGEMPKATDQVKTHYHGTLIDGKVFDSSVDRGEPATFPVNGVIQGWQEALQLMKVGSKWKLFVPANLAYGDRGAGGSIGPNETLIFDVELLEILKKEEPKPEVAPTPAPEPKVEPQPEVKPEESKKKKKK